VSKTTFLADETLWHELQARVRGARCVDAAIAYFGQKGATIMPLREGSRLIVDMSRGAVQGGRTDPREIEKLMSRGVQVFTRRNLHAKLIVADKSVISGSANVSKHSRQDLDEAALLTNDPAAVRRAREFIDRLCTEPVRPEYVEECKRLYKPPRFNGNHPNGQHSQLRVAHAKLWIVNLSVYSVPDAEAERYEQGKAKAERLLKREAQSKTDSFHWPYKPRMANELEFGDWVIQVTTYKDKSIVVYPPGQLLYIDNYLRDADSGKERWVFHLEAAARGQTITWKDFRRVANSVVGPNKLPTPRTKAIRDVQAADSLLGLWTPSGRVSRRRRVTPRSRRKML
jgi:hypothetical protein